MTVRDEARDAIREWIEEECIGSCDSREIFAVGADELKGEIEHLLDRLQAIAAKRLECAKNGGSPPSA